jgi:2-phosphosulfolactate phosphatase
MRAEDGEGMTVDVALAPSFVAREPERRRATVYVVIDLIRATTTLSVFFAHGGRRVYVAESIAGARAAARVLAEEAAPPPLLGGESGGVAPPGFDHGNSPAEYAAGDVAGRDLVFATTNGTRALLACAGGAAVLAGALRNAAAVAGAAVRLAARPAPADAPAGAPDRPGEASGAALDRDAPPAIAVICAGLGGRPAYDDTIGAGYLVARIEGELAALGIASVLTEGARIALAAANVAARRGLAATLEQCHAARTLAAVGLAGDLDWCVALDADAAVPMVRGRDPRGDLLVVEPWDGGPLPPIR